MNTRTLTVALACIATVALVGCDPADAEPTPDTPTTTQSTAQAPAATPSKATEAPAEAKAVPNFVGMGLQSAQDVAQKEGFAALTSHDSAGRGRAQVFDRNWKVCSQNVAAGKTVPADTTLDFGTVKLEEDCPANDAEAPETADGKMPSLVGKSVKVARKALDSSTSITVTDAVQSRMVLMESNWQVCTQSPSPGAALNGQPVEFTAVKFEEDCP